MPQDPNNNEDELEKLRIENERKKLKLSQEQGANFMQPSGENELDPILEAQFLDYVDQYENTYKNCKRIIVYDFIGNPEYNNADAVSDDEIHLELQKVVSVMNEKGVFLDTLCEVDDRLLYRFITEELFFEETDDIRIEGMTHNFIYEEFHPNHEYDIRNHSNDFIETYLNKESDYYTTFLTKEAEDTNKLKYFRDAFSSFSLEQFEINSISFDEEKSTVNFNINFSGTIEGSVKIQDFSGEGKMELLYMYDFWCIQSVVFPLPLTK